MLVWTCVCLHLEVAYLRRCVLLLGFKKGHRPQAGKTAGPTSLARHDRDADIQSRMGNTPGREAEAMWSSHLEAEA